MPTTEIALIPLNPNTPIGDPSAPSALIMKQTADTLHAQPGLQRIHFGPQTENPDILEMLITWASRQHHETFMSSPAYGPFVAKLGTIMSANASIHHVDFRPEGGLEAVLGAPVTELATFYHEGEVGEGWLGDAGKVAEWLGREARGDGFLGMAFGVTHEEVEYKGVKGKAAVAAIGWESKEGHMAFREKATFKENIGLLRGEAKAIEMHHVAVMEALK